MLSSVGDAVPATDDLAFCLKLSDVISRPLLLSRFAGFGRDVSTSRARVCFVVMLVPARFVVIRKIRRISSR
jgi:hypothetical protein